MRPDHTLVDQFPDAFQARMVCELLGAHGIPARIEHVRGMGGSGARLSARYCVYAPDAHLPQVKAVLESLAAAEPEPEVEAKAETPRPRRGLWRRLFGRR